MYNSAVRVEPPMTGQPLMQGFNMALAPNPMNTENVNNFDPDAFAQCNQGIANGFGPMFFNLRDPTFIKTNAPTEQRPSYHVPVLIANLAFYAFFIGALVGNSNRTLSLIIALIFIFVSYGIYVGVTCFLSDVRPYLRNSKRMDEYEATYNKMATGRAYFKFWIQCYHYTTRYNSRTRTTSRHRVTTHTMTEIFNLSQVIDESGHL
jgi:hypothetical protein